MRHVDVPERRARLGRRHHLAQPADTVEEAAAAMVGLHSSDPATVYLAARARVRDLTVVGVEEALYERRSLVRILGMRRTLFAVPRGLAAVVDASCTRALGPPERRRLVSMLEEQGVATDGAAWIADVEHQTLEALARLGEATARQLREEVPELKVQLSFGEGRRWAGTVGVSTRVLFLLATEGRVVRARPLGTWISGQYRWAQTARWLGHPLPELHEDEASATLIERWLQAFGPASFTDVKWWTGWTVRKTKKVLQMADAVEVQLDEGTGYLAPGDTEAVPPPPPWVAFLPGLDPTVMGWKERTWYLGPHGDDLFDRNGNAGPTVWADGEIVGGWSQDAEAGVVIELLADVDGATRGRIEAERERLERWLGGVRVTPRFRTPLERRLAGAT